MSRRILIADNDEEVRDGLQPLLSNAGFTTLFAVDGTGLIKQVRKHQPHLMMIDFCLPAGNAIVLVQALRGFPEFARTPIFILGAREHRTSANQVFDSGATAFLPKPLNRQVLFSLIARFLPSETSINCLNLVQGVDSRSRQPTNSAQVFFD